MKPVPIAAPVAAPIVLDVKNLVVNFDVHGGTVKAVRDVSFHVRKGECLCIVGESGSGKSVTMQSVMRLLPSPPARILSGTALLNGQDLLKMSPKASRKLFGNDIAMIFQDPLASLNPTMTIGDQIDEVLKLHTDMSKQERKVRVLECLSLVRLPEPERRHGQYPHELSGGMRQRVMIAMALACNPKVLIADEPTTALDVTIQAQILSLIKELAKKFDMATILITHDLGVVAQMADRVAVMYAGRIVEEGTVDDVFYNTAHAYTAGLKNAMPKDGAKSALQPIPGTPPDLFSPPPGCGFAPRCPFAMDICHKVTSSLTTSITNHRVSCWLHHPHAKSNLESSGLSSIASESV